MIVALLSILVVLEKMYQTKTCFGKSTKLNQGLGFTMTVLLTVTWDRKVLTHFPLSTEN